ncbi:hypothetical protein FHR38_002661 [Micromonospora polyrhachis]|uniref:Uncharacterized protein n=1 Tax=Micromonospora polyrhachis TaxID=1282883 RepID=A0A7W7SQ81_9ACTN|nr:hypothetical protein [Micromonospora polyrhachis]
MKAAFVAMSNRGAEFAEFAEFVLALTARTTYEVITVRNQVVRRFMWGRREELCKLGKLCNGWRPR